MLYNLTFRKKKKKKLNQKEIKEWVEADFNKLTEKILTDKAIIQIVIDSKAPKDIGSVEDESNNIRKNQVADTLNTFIEFCVHSIFFFFQSCRSY